MSFSVPVVSRVRIQSKWPDKPCALAKAVIATGARAADPPIPGLNEVPYLTNETLFSLTELPQRFGIIGAGPIHCEMAHSFARLGSAVYLIEATHGIRPYPTQAEAIRKTGDLYNRTRLTPFVKKLMARWLVWMR